MLYSCVTVLLHTDTSLYAALQRARRYYFYFFSFYFFIIFYVCMVLWAHALNKDGLID